MGCAQPPFKVQGFDISLRGMFLFRLVGCSHKWLQLNRSRYLSESVLIGVGVGCYLTVSASCFAAELALAESLVARHAKT